MKKIIILTPLLLSVLLLHPCFGQIDQCKGSLQGIQSIGVMVGDVPQSYKIVFLSQLKSDVEQMLKTAGISIIDLDTLAKPEDKRKFFDTSGFLEINVYINDLPKAATPGAEPVMVYSIQLQLRQRIELARNQVKCLTPTWVEGRYNAICPPSQLEASARKSLKEVAAVFVDAFSAENPKQAGKP
jgi:hypothetical protein